MNSEIQHLLRLLEEGYREAAWHGPNLRGAVRGITPKKASWRPRPGRHNIWEIAVHAAYWKYAVRRRLTGAKRGSFVLEGSDWFPRPERESKEAWRQDLALLDAEHRLLLEAVKSMTASRLHRRSSTGKHSFADLVVGAAYHDVYHAGQVQLLKRLQRTSGSNPGR